MHLSLPGPLGTWSIRQFAKSYNINVSEAEKPLDQYSSIGDFFVRKLRPGLRPLAEGPIVHPADSQISQVGEIIEGQCIQAKGKTYSVADLCGDPALAEKFKAGLFCTYYLCPTDYHRVHSPVDGSITSCRYIPGALWPVNTWSTANIENLFGVNERVVLEIESRLGPALLVFVGATNVGQMQMEFDSAIVTNTVSTLIGARKPVEKKYSPAIEVQRGQELGRFHMGSTVVMIYPKSIRMQRGDWETFLNQPVKMGEGLL